RARDRIALLPGHDLRLPVDLAAALVERDELTVELAEVHPAVAECDAAARPAAADGGDVRVELGVVHPFRGARVRTDGEDVVGARDRVDDALVLEGLRLARILSGDARLQVDVP